MQAATSSKRDASTLKRHLMAHCWTDRDHTITNLICCAGRHDKDWSSDYRLYSRDLDQQALFKPIVQRAAKLTASSAPIVLCVDDSQMKKTGRQIKEAGYYRDPLGPKFHTNLVYALRFVQMSIGVPDESYVRTHRTIPVAASVIVKLPKDASEASRTENSPSVHALALLRQVRENMDEQDQSLMANRCRRLTSSAKTRAFHGKPPRSSVRAAQ